MPDHTSSPDPRDQPREDDLPVAGSPHALSARIRYAITAVNHRLFTASAGIYVAAGSFMGFEALAFLLGFAPLWPIAIPMIIAGIALSGLIVRWMRTRRDRTADTAGTSPTPPSTRP